MSRNTRFHILERELKNLSKRPVPARMLSAIRKRDSDGSAHATSVSTRMPEDLEGEIAIVRGREHPRPSLGLLQLENRLLGVSRPEAPSVAVQRPDYGGASSGTGTHILASSLPHLSQAAEQHAEALRGDSVLKGQFTVEPFEELPSPKQELTPRSDLGTRTPPISPSETRETPGVEHGKYERTAESQGVVVQQRRPPEDVAKTEHIEALENPNEPVSAAPEDKQWNETLRSAGGAARVTVEPIVASEEPASTKLHPHDVFSQMGMAMEFANNFDLGSVDLSARFDQFDAELAAAPKRAEAPLELGRGHSLGLDDFDMVADLAEIVNSQSETPAGTASPICESTHSKEPQPAGTPSG